MNERNDHAFEDEDGATILDDGLSVCDEDPSSSRPYRQITSAQAAALRSDASHYRCFTLSLLSFTFLVSVIVATARYYGRPSVRHGVYGRPWVGDIWGFKAREEENARRLKETLEYLIKYGVSHPSTLEPEANFGFGSLGKKSYTPQYRAARWIARDDLYRIDIPSVDSKDYNDRQFKQRYALAVLYFATGGEEHWMYKMGFLSGRHECYWAGYIRIVDNEGEIRKIPFGVFCDGAPDWEEWGDWDEDPWAGRRTVTGVAFPPKNRLFGTLPTELQHLTYLKVLDVQHEPGLFGSIPYQYGWMKHLSHLAITDTSIDGEIPRDFAHLSKLQVLMLDRNQLNADTTKGDFDFLEDLKSLVLFSVNYNSKITGTISDRMISNLYDLQVLSLSNCGMYGPLPSGLSKLRKLQKLRLDDNEFEGGIDMMQNLTELTHVYLEKNNFNGTLHYSSFSELKNLVRLDISNNTFGGFVPRQLFNMSQLTVLDMSENKLEGELPSDMDIFNSSLEFLSLHSNNIKGPIRAGIRKLKHLKVLDLSINQFSGEIPEDVRELQNLDILFLGKNNFDEAPMPEWIRNMTHLTEISLKSSSLNGTIPEWLGELTDLTFLDLGENGLTNTIPQSLGNLTKLMVLILNGNRLEGELGLGQLLNLETLLIDNNELTGDTDAMCAHDITHFIADCVNNTNSSLGALGAEIACPCCTLCCLDEDASCNDAEWLGNHVAIKELGYDKRMFWDFEDAGVISPYINYNFYQNLGYGVTVTRHPDDV